MTKRIRKNHPERTQYDGLKLDMSEKVNKPSLKYIVNNMRSFGLSRIVYEPHNETTTLDSQTSLLKRYLSRVKGNGEVPILYQQNDEFGRYHARGGIGLANISRRVRHTICKEYYIDVDIKNAHPVLLSQYLTKNNFEHPKLQNYIEHREDVFSELMEILSIDRDDAKRRMLAIINGGMMTDVEFDKAPQEFVNFYNELFRIREFVNNNEETLFSYVQTKKLKRFKKDKKPIWNVDGSVISHLMSKLENACLMEMKDFFTRAGFQVQVLCFDGLMIRIEDGLEVTDEILQQCSDHVFTKTEYRVTLVVKDMNEDLDIPPLESEDFDVDEDYISEDHRRHVTECLLDGDYGLSVLFSSLVKDDIHVVDEMSGRAFLWSNEKLLWEERARNSVVTRVYPTLSPHIGLLDLTNDKNLQKFVSKLKCYGTLSAVVNLSNSVLFRPEFEAKTNNKYLHLFPIAGGRVVDLMTGQVTDRLKKHNFTFQSPVEYENEDLQKPTPNADRFFGEIFSNNAEIISYVQRMLGYFLTGETSDRSIYIWFGHGKNGKGTLSKIISKIMAQFYTQGSKETMLGVQDGNKNKGGPTPHLIPLVGARAVMVSENEAGDKLDSGLLKGISGEDPISCRGLFKSEMTFIPRAKMILQTNFKPVFDGADTAMVDRVKLVPFGCRFGDSEDEIPRDIAFIDSLLNEHLSEVFRWILRGAIVWYQTKDITMPDETKKQCDEYVEECDTIGYFFNDNERYKVDMTFEVGTERSFVYTEFKAWSINKGINPVMRNAKFYELCEKKGYKKRSSSGKRFLSYVR